MRFASFFLYIEEIAKPSLNLFDNMIVVCCRKNAEKINHTFQRSNFS